MTSPPHRVSERVTTIHHLITPTARILAAAVILVTGMGISAVFWKMPKSAEHHALCHDIDKNLAAAPLPSELTALLAPGEQITLPAFDIAPVIDSGESKYAQAYPMPAVLAALDAEQGKLDVLSKEDETMIPVTPKKIEPMRRIVVEKPIIVESVNREFPSKPESVNTTDKSDELLSMFHYAENSRTDVDHSAEPADPFPEAASTVPVLRPLQSVQFSGLIPLTPLQDSELQSFLKTP